MSRDIIRQWVNVLTLGVAVVVNALANALPLNGLTTGEISDRFKVFFTPAGYVFTIWGLIYLGLAAFAIYQALPSQRANPRLRRIGYWFALGGLANTAWIFLWHYLLTPITIVAMLLLLLSLIMIYLRLDIGGSKVGAVERWLVDTPFSIYLGWITVATVANVTVLLDLWEWNGWGISPEIWTVIVLAVAVGIGAAVAFKRRDVAFGLVLVWALAGIAVRNAGVPLVAIAAWVSCALAGLVLLLGRLLIRPSYQR
ncbi:MAG: tryptophan-rich sensory protein [Anaerolineales bacterium]|jgi:hypothetical protein